VIIDFVLKTIITFSTGSWLAFQYD
jgi:hypothetical protein